MVKLVKTNDLYFYEFSNDESLSILVSPFVDGALRMRNIKKELLDPQSRGISGNKTDILIEEDFVTIGPTPPSEYDEDYITIERKLFLRLVNTWEKLVNLNVQEIIIEKINDEITMRGNF